MFLEIGLLNFKFLFYSSKLIFKYESACNIYLISSHSYLYYLVKGFENCMKFNFNFDNWLDYTVVLKMFVHQHKNVFLVELCHWWMKIPFSWNYLFESVYSYSCFLNRILCVHWRIDRNKLFASLKLFIWIFNSILSIFLIILLNLIYFLIILERVSSFKVFQMQEFFIPHFYSLIN